MTAYDEYAKFYDATQGSSVAAGYKHLLARFHPHARSLLEIACGTGVVLQQLAPNYEQTAGLDISGPMLRIARRKLPHTKFYRQDMTHFRINASFDAVICPYDAINHLLRFRDWMRTFQSVKRHLNPHGVFIFDMNTRFKLEQLMAKPPFVQAFDGGTLIMDVVDAGRQVSDWRLQIYERERGSRFRLHNESIKEVAYSADRVRDALQRIFRFVRALDAHRDWSRPTKSSTRLYWICRN